MNKRILLLIIFALIGCYVSTYNVRAMEDLVKFQTISSCGNGESCLLICSYSDNSKPIEIYYMLETRQWQISWNKNAKGSKTGALTLSSSELVNYSKIYDQNGILDRLVESGTCPEYAHVDTELWRNEICFDMDGKWCSENIGNQPLNVFTQFSDCSDGECSKTYDIFEDIRNYSEKVKFVANGITLNELDYDNIDPSMQSSIESLCESLNSKELTMEKLVDTNFSQDFLLGYSGDFMKNWISYTGLQDDVRKSYLLVIDELKNYCSDSAREKLENGDITEEEYDAFLNNRDEAILHYSNNSKSDVENIMNESLKGDATGGTCQTDGYEGTCAYYLGHVSQNNKNCPIYWINLVYQIIKYSVVAFLVVLIMIDFIKETINPSDDASPVIRRNVIRLCVVIAIFITPTLIENIYYLLTGKTGILCGIK